MNGRFHRLDDGWTSVVGASDTGWARPHRGGAWALAKPPGTLSHLARQPTPTARVRCLFL